MMDGFLVWFVNTVRLDYHVRMHKWSRQLELGKKKAQISLSYTRQYRSMLISINARSYKCVILRTQPQTLQGSHRIEILCQFLFDGPTNSTADRWSASSPLQTVGVENNEFSEPVPYAITSKAKRSVSLFITLMSI